jgi:hypothetical protein
MATAAKFVLPIPIFLAYLVPRDVDVTGNITAKLCEVWSEFNIFCILVTMVTTTIFIFFHPQKLPHTTVDIHKIGIGRTNFVAIAMKTEKGDFFIFWISFIKLHETS